MRLLLALTLLLAIACGPGRETKTGRELYLAYGCAACHGEDADGRGPGAGLSHVKPRDLTHLDQYRGPKTAEGIASTIAFGVAEGRTGMPAYPDIPQRERVAIAEYLLDLAAQPPRAKLAVTDAWVRTPNPAVDVAAAYLTLENNTAAPVALVAVSSRQAETVEMHETKTADGMMSMQKVGRIAVPAHGRTALAPGSSHLMLITLAQPLLSPVELTMRFDDGTVITTQAEIRDE
ncbi:MAG TPA: copper chaperone PCu(A)C [Thermoanaerobaculia bacterium]|jgi:copper(I)-binding protein